MIDNVSEAGPLPFELRVLEALLDETARQFERRQRRLELLANSIEDDIHKQLKQHSRRPAAPAARPEVCGSNLDSL